MVKWISHRGESYDAPENTLAAFRLAWERQTDGIECDVHLTADGQVAVVHDATTGRMGNACVEVEKTNWKTLREIEVSGRFADRCPGARIPLLGEVLAELGPGRECYLELKGGNAALVSAVRRILRESGVAPEQITVIAFDRDLIRLAKLELSGCRALWLTDLQNRDNRRFGPGELIGILNDLSVDGVDGMEHHELDASLIDAVHRAGKIFAVWTVDNPFRARRLAADGVDAITSNCAAQLRDWLASSSASSGRENALRV